MSSCASFIFLFVFSFLTSFGVFAQDPTYRYHTCSDPTTSSGSSVFFSNLETLLSTLSSIDASFTGFQKATVGEPPDRVTELYDCRGDLSPQRCRNCLVFAAKEALIRCPYQRDVTFFYDECILSTMTTLFSVIFSNPRNVTSNNVDRFTDLVLLTLNKAATEAVNSPKKFGATKTNFTALENLYGQVQCTPDLTRQDCSRCLQEIIDLIPTEKLGARVITPSCSSRYELFQFYNEAAGRTPPPPRPGDYSVRINITRKGRHYSVRINNTRKGFSVRIIIAVVPITAILLLFIAVLIVWARRKKTIGVKKGETEPLAEDGDDITTAGSLQFDFKAIEAATSNFSPSNKLGHGGFGAVYMVSLLHKASL